MLQLSSVTFKKNSFIFLEGTATNDRFYIIQEGRVGCLSTLSQDQVATRVLTTGDFVGVVPCMSGHLQTENVKALTDVRAISIKKEQYPQLIVNNTAVALKIVKSFTKQTRLLNEQFTQLTMQQVSSEDLSTIYEVAKYYDSQGLYNIAVNAYYLYIRDCPKGFHIEDAKKRYVALKAQTTLRVNFGSELTRQYKKNTLIMCEGQSGADMFVIKSGQVAICKIVNGSEVVLAMLKEGDMFGEMALLENKARSASAIAREDCVLGVINRTNFDAMVKTEPHLIARLTSSLSERLWFMQKQISCALLTTPIHRVVDMLALQLEKVQMTQGPYQMDLTPEDLVNMCGFTKEVQREVLAEFIHKNIIVVTNGKIYVPNCQSVFSFDALYKRQEVQERRNKQQEKYV